MTPASRYSLLTFLVLMFVPLDGLSASESQETRGTPNVLFIAVDDLRTSLGCYGDTLVKSPNIDRLAATSRRFTRAYCHQAVCGPSRTSILTGRLPDNTRVWHNRNLFRDTLPDLVTLPEYFKNHGYHAQSLGKVFSGRDREAELDPQSWSVPPLLKGPDWSNYALDRNQGKGGKGPATEMADLPDQAYPDGKLAALAVETLEDLAKRQQPFFLAVGFFKPHLPFCAPKKYWDLYDPADFQLSGDVARTRNAPAVAYPDHQELGGYKDVPKDEKVNLKQSRHLRHGYYACVSYADAQVGKLLDALERLGLEEHTIVVFWGDHGYSLGEADHWCKATNFEMDTRTPLMFRFPGMPEPGIPTDAMIEYVDIYPTVVELAGLPRSSRSGRNEPGSHPERSQAGRTPVRAEPVRSSLQAIPAGGDGLLSPYSDPPLYALGPVAFARNPRRRALRLRRRSQRRFPGGFSRRTGERLRRPRLPGTARATERHDGSDTASPHEL